MSESPANLRLALSELRRGPIVWEQGLKFPHKAMGRLPEAVEGPLSLRVRASLAKDGSVCGWSGN